jgi:glycosyltransferase involved in cell wall biosynthesis
LRIAAFISHPIQYFTPLWQELSARPGVELCVYYFSRHGLVHSQDPGFGRAFAWDIDLLAGHAHRFLPRRWPTRDPLDPSPRALNAGLLPALRQGWDVVFVNGYAHWNNRFIALACRALDIPVLCFGDSNLHSEPSKPKAKLAAKRLALRLFLPHVSACLAAGGASRRYFERYGVDPASIFICPYAVDVGRFRRTVAQADAARLAELRARWRIPQGKRVILFCGKLVRWKRPLDVLLAVRALQRADTLAVFVGDGELRGQIEREGGSGVVSVGFVNQSEIPLALSLAEVLVLSSDYEPYGMVVAEAQCLGVPAVVSDACGCHGPDSVLQDGVSGFVYPTGDVAALRERLALLLEDEPLRQRMRAAAAIQGETQSQIAAADGFLAAAAFARRGAA